jgi:hypothetical protein
VTSKVKVGDRIIYRGSRSDYTDKLGVVTDIGNLEGIETLILLVDGQKVTTNRSTVRPRGSKPLSQLEVALAEAAGTAKPITAVHPHWLTRYDADDGEPYGDVCDCEIGKDHGVNPDA